MYPQNILPFYQRNIFCQKISELRYDKLHFKEFYFSRSNVFEKLEKTPSKVTHYTVCL